MYRMTFPSTAQVSLDAAGTLTDGRGGTQNGHGLLAPRKRGKGVERVKMLSPGIYHNLAG